MPIYVLLSQVTAQGAKTIVERPERIQEVNHEIEAFGARVLHQYATLGQYDFVNIVEAPDPAVIARVSAELGARGTLKVQTLAALPVNEFIAKIRGK
jgi:uncharacterized protein with GYD domain